MSPMGIVKFLGAWGCIIGATVLLVLTNQYQGLPMVLSVLGIAFSVAPESA